MILFHDIAKINQLKTLYWPQLILQLQLQSLPRLLGMLCTLHVQQCKQKSLVYTIVWLFSSRNSVDYLYQIRSLCNELATDLLCLMRNLLSKFSLDLDSNSIKTLLNYYYPCKRFYCLLFRSLWKVLKHEETKRSLLTPIIAVIAQKWNAHPSQGNNSYRREFKIQRSKYIKKLNGSTSVIDIYT